MKSKFILITGGAGFISSHFIEEFPSERYVIVDNDPKKIVKPDDTHILADVRKESELRPIFEMFEFELILHLAAAHKDFGIEPDEYHSTNVNGTEILIRLAEEFNIPKVIFYSSVAVYGDNGPPSNDGSETNPTNDYGKSKLEAEGVLTKWFEKDPSRLLIIIRPALVYGERNIANMYRLIDQIAKGRYFNVGKGDNIKSIAYVKNLVGATHYLQNKLESGKHIFNYADQPHLQISEVSSIIAKALGLSKPRSVPKSLLVLAALPFDLLIKVTGKDLPISSNRVKKLATQTYHKAQLIFENGFTPTYSPVEGLKRMVNWYMHNNNH